MTLMEWNDALKLGIDTIDEQHLMLVDMINELHERILSGQGEQAVADALQGLKGYAVYHFREEEGLMSRAEFPRTRKHKAEHAEFEQAVERFSAEAMISSEQVGREMLEFLRDWLVDHILGTDMILAGHLKRRS